MSKILKFLKELTISKVLELLIPALVGTLGVALPILFRDQIAPLLTQTQWSVLSALLLVALLWASRKTFQYRQRLNSKKQPKRKLLKRLKQQHEQFPEVQNSPNKLLLWINKTEPLLNSFPELKKQFTSYNYRHFQTDPNYRNAGHESMNSALAKAIATLEYELDDL